MSIHNGKLLYNHSQPWISHISLQGHDVGQLDMAKSTWWPSSGSAAMKKPIVWDEVMYEGDIPSGWGALTGGQMADRYASTG